MGRPKGKPNIATRAIKDIIDSKVDMGDIISKLVELTNGVQTMKAGSVYKEKPDTQAAKILLEYRYGKAPQSVDITSNGKELTKNIIKLPDGTEISI